MQRSLLPTSLARPRLLRFAGGLVLSALTLAGPVAAQDTATDAGTMSSDALKSELLISLAQPLPITIIGPLMAPDISVETSGETSGETSQVILPGARIMGIIPLGDVSFDLKALGDKRYEVSNFSLPSTIELGGGMQLNVGQTNMSGVWSFETRSYESLRLGFEGLTVKAAGGSVELARLGRLELAIDQQGKQDIDASMLHIKGVNLAADVPNMGPLIAGEISARVLVKTGQPLDLQSLITRSMQSAFLAPDQSKLMGLLSFLQERRYDLLQLEVSLSDLDATLQKTPLRAGQASLRIDGSDLTLGELGRLSLTVSGQDLSYKPDEDVTITLGQGDSSIAVSGLSIAKILQAVQQIQAAGHGMQVEASLADLYDAFLGFDDLSVSLDANDLFAINPEDDDLESFGFKTLSLAERFAGFKQRRGEIGFNAYLDGFHFTLPELKPKYRFEYNADSGEYERSDEPVPPSERRLAKRAIEKRIVALLAPDSVTLNFSASNLGDALAYDIMKGLKVDKNLETSWLALLGVLPTLEIRMQSDMDYRTDTASLSANSDLTLVPMRALSFNAYTGKQTSRFDGWNAFVTEARALLMEVEDEALVVFDPYVAVMQAFGRPDGDDSLVWDMTMDGEKDYIVINDRRFYLPDLSALIGLPTMMEAMEDLF